MKMYFVHIACTIRYICIVQVLTYSYNFFMYGTCIFMLETTSITASKQIHFILNYISPKYFNSLIFILLFRHSCAFALHIT